MKNTQKGFVVPLVIVSFIVIVAGIYFFEGKKTDLPASTTDIGLQTQKKYSNTEQGLQFAYPANWYIESEKKVEANQYDEGMTYFVTLLDSHNDNSNKSIMTDRIVIAKLKTPCINSDWKEENGNYITSLGSVDKFLKRNYCVSNNISAIMYVHQDGSVTEPKETLEKIATSIER